MTLISLLADSCVHGANCIERPTALDILGIFLLAGVAVGVITCFTHWRKR